MATDQTETQSPYVGRAVNEGGTGYVPSYVGPSGTVPIGADPVDGETLSGKRTLIVWAEITHVND